MSDRVTLPPVEDFDEDQRAVYERFPSNLARALLLTKSAAAPHLSLGAAFATGLLTDMVREVVVLRVAALRNSDFERSLHYPLALDAGLTEDDIGHIESGRPDRLPAQHAALVAYVDDLMTLHKAGDDAFRGLTAHFSVPEIAEITHLAGHASMTALYLSSLEIPLDAHRTSWSRLAEIGN